MSKPDPALVEESAPRGKGRKNNPEKTRQDILRAAIDEFVAQGSRVRGSTPSPSARIPRSG